MNDNYFNLILGYLFLLIRSDNIYFDNLYYSTNITLIQVELDSDVLS